MDSAALSLALDRLVKAEVANKTLQDVTSLNEIKSAWSDFLIASNGVYAKLQQGAKGHQKSLLWFSNVVKVRKQDKLLRYIHHARNAYEHGIQQMTVNTKSEMHLMPDGTYTGYIAPENMEIGKLEVISNGKSVVLDSPIKRKFVVLAPVWDRGVKYEPPSPLLEPRQASWQSIPHLRDTLGKAEVLTIGIT